MTESEGVVLLSTTQERAVFLTGTDLTTLQETLAAIVDRPTVAGGPLDLAGLERLARAVDLAEEDSAPTGLSAAEEAGLELLKNQAAIRSGLPLRIRRTCKECGHEHLVNPARQAQPAPAATGPNSGLDTFATSVNLLSEGHPFLATLALFSGSGTDGAAAAGSAGPVCGRCDGDKFGSHVVTICPGCRAIRDESVLLTCPECEFDFLSRRTDDEFWVPPEKAIADAALARNVALLKEKAAGFENNLWPEQLQALLAALRPDERLFGMCRCGLPNQVGRYVALLLTSQQLVWTRQSPVASATGGNVPWSDVLAVHPYPGDGAAYNRGVQLETRTGPPLVLTNFRGIGVAFTSEPISFTVDAMHTIMNELWLPHRPPVQAPAAVPPGPSAPASAAPQAIRVLTPGPGWHPDPWQMARLRWWDGTQWTPYLMP